MARPKKHKELKRNHQIMLRLTDTEYEIISSNAKNASLPLAEYARKLITGKTSVSILRKCESIFNRELQIFLK